MFFVLTVGARVMSFYFSNAIKLHMSSHRGSWEQRHRLLKKEFELLEQQERFFEEKLQSKSKVSRGRLQSVKEFGTTLSEYDSLLTEIEHKTVELKEKFGNLIKIADEFYFTNY